MQRYEMLVRNRDLQRNPSNNKKYAANQHMNRWDSLMYPSISFGLVLELKFFGLVWELKTRSFRDHFDVRFGGHLETRVRTIPLPLEHPSRLLYARFCFKNCHKMISNIVFK